VVEFFGREVTKINNIDIQVASAVAVAIFTLVLVIVAIQNHNLEKNRREDKRNEELFALLIFVKRFIGKNSSYLNTNMDSFNLITNKIEKNSIDYDTYPERLEKLLSAQGKSFERLRKSVESLVLVEEGLIAKTYYISKCKNLTKEILDLSDKIKVNIGKVEGKYYVHLDAKNAALIIEKGIIPDLDAYKQKLKELREKLEDELFD